uniref:Membrane-associated phosphatidylinositol transfer protein 3 n=1 Tax=Neogobius melanostomus TaxID=47308 RepID=A0A8C6TFI2_9GOBI
MIHVADLNLFTLYCLRTWMGDLCLPNFLCVCVPADVMEGKNAILLGMSQWNSNDLVEQIETLGQTHGMYCAKRHTVPATHRSAQDTSFLIAPQSKCKTHVLLLVSSDVSTLASVLEKVTRAHFQAAAEHVKIKLVPCPPVCAEAFSLVSNLNPYSYDESCVSSSVDHLPLAALPLLAIVSPRYQDAVATVIARANQVYRSFLQSEDGQGFTGQVCVRALRLNLTLRKLCLYVVAACGLLDPSRYHLLSPLFTQDSSAPHSESSLGLSSSKRLSKSNIDISAPNNGQGGPSLSRKQSDSYDGDSSAAGQRGFFSRSSNASVVWNPGRFDFEVSDCFLLGCPLGLVLAMRRTVLPNVQVCQLRPACSQIFNLFYPSDPSASRLEPLLQSVFHRLPPFAVPRYQRYPLGDGRTMLLDESIQGHFNVFLKSEQAKSEPPVDSKSEKDEEGEGRRPSVTSVESETSVCSMSQLGNVMAYISSLWWGSKRLDYALYCPDVLTAFPTVALPHLFHASYWESTDVAAFVLRQLMRCDCVKTQEADNLDSASFSPSSPREKWLRRRTHVKLRNVTANHRVNDVIVTVLRSLTKPQSGRWVHFDTEVTNSSGRVTYTIPKSKKLSLGVYPIKMVVKGDQTSAEAYLTVLPRGMECVVFSIDGSFAASVSIMGSDPKVRPGAVDVVRHWQDLGYLIIYITGRPDMQKQRVVSWLSQHNFPHGMIFFSEGLVHDPLRQKTIFLRNLIQECHIKINSAYGSMKDISVYNMLGLSPSQIYIVGRPSKKYQNQCQFLSEGYAAHLSTLQFGHRARPKKSPSVRMVLRKGSFGLTAKPDFLCKRTHLRRTMSVQQPDPPCTANPKPERAQSQPESDKDHGGPSVVGERGSPLRSHLHYGSMTHRSSLSCSSVTCVYYISLFLDEHKQISSDYVQTEL